MQHAQLAHGMLMLPHVMPAQPAPANGTPNETTLRTEATNQLWLALCSASQRVANATKSSDTADPILKNEGGQVWVEQHMQRGGSHALILVALPLQRPPALTCCTVLEATAAALVASSSCCSRLRAASASMLVAG